MFGRWSALSTVLSLATAPLMWGAPAQAQCRLCSEPTTVANAATDNAAPIRLEIVSTIDFDRLLFSGTGSGLAQINPDGSRSATGAITSVGARAIAGEVLIRGEPGRMVRVDLPRSIELFGLKGGSIRIESIVSDLPTLPSLDSAGLLRIRIGGALQVSGDIDGDFRGDIPVIVDYL